LGEVSPQKPAILSATAARRSRPNYATLPGRLAFAGTPCFPRRRAHAA